MRSATWRNAFLYGAQELRHGVFQLPARGTIGPDTLAGISSDIFFDMLAIRIDPTKAAGQAFTVNWHFTDRAEKMAMTVSRAVKQRFELHKKIARWTWPIWMYVSVTGVVIYLLLYQIFPQRS